MYYRIPLGPLRSYILQQETSEDFIYTTGDPLKDFKCPLFSVRPLRSFFILQNISEVFFSTT